MTGEGLPVGEFSTVGRRNELSVPKKEGIFVEVGGGEANKAQTIDLTSWLPE